MAVDLGFAVLVALGLDYRAELEELPGLSASSPPRFGRVALAVPAAILAAVLLVGFGVFMLVPVAGTNRALTFPSQLPDDTPVRSGGQLTNPSLGAGDPASDGKSSDSAPRASFGYSGFSKQLDTSLRGRPDDTLVMRVPASSPTSGAARRSTAGTDGSGRSPRTSRISSVARPPSDPAVPADGPVQTAATSTSSSRPTTSLSPARTRSSP